METTATATASGNWTDPNNWDIRINGNTLKGVGQDGLMQQVNALVDRAEREGKCNRLPFGQIEVLDKTV
jgi:hypothetical protein